MTGKEMESEKTLATMSLSEVYLQWVNEFISVQAFADYHGLALDSAVQLISVAREASAAEIGISATVQDIMSYLDERYTMLADELKAVTDCQQFTFYCRLIGVEGYPVKAWYEHLHGEGAWIEPE